MGRNLIVVRSGYKLHSLTYSLMEPMLTVTLEYVIMPSDTWYYTLNTLLSDL